MDGHDMKHSWHGVKRAGMATHPIWQQLGHVFCRAQQAKQSRPGPARWSVCTYQPGPLTLWAMVMIHYFVIFKVWGPLLFLIRQKYPHIK